jgi:hypothetical protein
MCGMVDIAAAAFVEVGGDQQVQKAEYESRYINAGNKNKTDAP